MALALSERDLRQLERMKERLFLFERDEIRLQALISDLDFLIDSFESAEPSWLESVREEWSTLEEVYAVNLDRGVAVDMDRESEGLVDRAVHKLFELVAAAQAEY